MKVITNTADLAAFCEALSSVEYITGDTEFMRESTFWPILCLVQVAGPDDEAIIDPLADGIDLQPLYDLIANENVLKVMHAASQDIEIFHHEGGVTPQPLFDTQIAAMVCGFGDQVGYERFWGIQSVGGLRDRYLMDQPVCPRPPLPLTGCRQA